MKKLSVILIALLCTFFISCSNDPKVEGEFVKAVDEVTAKIESASSLDDYLQILDDLQKIQSNEQFQDLHNTGAAKEAAEKLEKAADAIAEKMK